MKTAEQVKEEIDSAIKSIKRDSTEAEIKAVKKDLVFLRMIKMYLDTNPREEFVKAQKDELQRRIDLLPTHYEGWQTGKVLTKYKDPYRSYCAEMGLAGMKQKIKTLDFILND